MNKEEVFILMKILEESSSSSEDEDEAISSCLMLLPDRMEKIKNTDFVEMVVGNYSAVEVFYLKIKFLFILI